MIAALALATLLTLTDPPNDAVGPGELAPPTSPAYRSAAAFDLLSVEALEQNGRLAVVLELGALPDPFELPLGFSLPVIDVYLDTGEGGAEGPLPGLGLELPSGSRWRYALRLTGDAAIGVTAVGPERREVPVEVALDGSRLVVRTPFPVDRVEGIAAAVGVYDPFGETPWRPIERSASPWAFSGASAPPAVDVLAADAGAQRRVLERGELPFARSSRDLLDGRLWLVLAVLGLGLALYGATLRTGLAALLEGTVDAWRGRDRAESPPEDPEARPAGGQARPSDAAAAWSAPGRGPAPEGDAPIGRGPRRGAVAWDASGLPGWRPPAGGDELRWEPAGGSAARPDRTAVGEAPTGPDAPADDAPTADREGLEPAGGAPGRDEPDGPDVREGAEAERDESPDPERRSTGS